MTRAGRGGGVMETLWWAVPGLAVVLFLRVIIEAGGLHWALRPSGTKRQRHQRYRAWKTVAGAPLFTIRRTWVDDEVLAATAVLLILMGSVLILVAAGIVKI